MCHAFDCAMGTVHCRGSFGCDTEEAFRTSAAFRRRIAAERFDVAFYFHAIQCCVDGSKRDLAVGARFDFLTHRDAIGSIFKAHEGQQNEMFELAEVAGAKHYFYILEQITGIYQILFRWSFEPQRQLLP